MDGAVAIEEAVALLFGFKGWAKGWAKNAAYPYYSMGT
jgi:hypothetical protein